MSGYPRGFRSKIISEGIAGYVNILKRRFDSDLPLNRPKEMIRSQGRHKKSMIANNWFNSGSRVYDTVLFVPSTPSSSLAKILKEHEAKNDQGRKSRIKIVERAGVSVKNMLAPNYPWGIEKCSDPECFPCSTAVAPLKVSCRVPGIPYCIECVLCEHTGEKSVYYGQSGKNCYMRGKKHIEDFSSGNPSHCMTIHAKVHHPDVPHSVSNFRMVPLRRISKPLDRQISEALTISNASVDILMNSGSEWRAGAVPRASVVGRPRQS